MKSSPGVRELQLRAVSQTLFCPTTLRAAINCLGFVQADPIRAPARAQDLILRHRVNGYHAGDLDRCYLTLDIEEDVLYAYGFLDRGVWRLLHPRSTARTRLPKLEQEVLANIRSSGPTHPNRLTKTFGQKRVINAWGGYSKATKFALERLHYRGLVRIARRENGIRIYEAAPALEGMSPEDRIRNLIHAVIKVLAPVQTQTLQAIVSRLRREIRGAPAFQAVLLELLGTGEFERQSVDGIEYIWPASRMPLSEVPRQVRFLAPFDPVVWDRRRFEHLWGWSYRFEAYTPQAKRIRGYYAMPLLCHERVIGWANAAVLGDRLNVELGFVGKRPSDRDFRLEMEAEIERLRAFLKGVPKWRKITRNHYRDQIFGTESNLPR